MLEWHRRKPFPLIDFDRPEELQTGVATALEFWGLEAAARSEFFDPDLASAGGDGDWTSEVESPEALDLWRALAELASG